jgi:hypothetical protein
MLIAKLIAIVVISVGCLFITPRPVQSVTDHNVMLTLLRGTAEAQKERAARIQWQMTVLRARGEGLTRLEPIETDSRCYELQDLEIRARCLEMQLD